MFACCHGSHMKSICDKFDIKISQTEKGVQINAEPKDQSKVKSFQKFVESWKDLCGSDCNC